MRRGKGKKKKALVRGRLKAGDSPPVFHHLRDAGEGVPTSKFRAHPEGRNENRLGPLATLCPPMLSLCSPPAHQEPVLGGPWLLCPQEDNALSPYHQAVEGTGIPWGCTVSQRSVPNFPVGPCPFLSGAVSL